MLNKITLLLLLLFSFASAEWSQPIRISAPGGYATPQIISNEDTLYVAAKAFNGRDKICFIKSPDTGITWSQERALSDTVNTGNILFPQIIRYGQNIIVSWRCFFLQNDSYNIGYRVSTNGGRSWRPISYALNPGLTGPYFYAISSSDSLINITYCRNVQDSLEFDFIQSTNFGQTWSNSQAIFRVIESAYIDQESRGDTVHIVWDGRFSLNHAWEVRYIRSTDRGLSWSSNVLISRDDLIRSFIPSICINQIGTIHVIWMDGKYSPYIDTGDILYKTSTDGGGTWSNEGQATFTHYAWYSDCTANGDTVHIAWSDEAMGLNHRSIYYTKSTDGGDNWAEPYWIDETLDDSADPNIIAADGKVYCIWTDGRANPDTDIIGGLYFSRFDPEPDAIENDISIPETFAFTAYPNPFNSSIMISYFFYNAGKIDIYDIQGQLIRSYIIEGGENGKIIWDATDAMGNKVSSGIYFAKAEASQESSVIKLLYLK
jgi:hypothetical protein